VPDDFTERPRSSSDPGVTVAEAAKRLRVSKDKIRTWIAKRPIAGAQHNCHTLPQAKVDYHTRGSGGFRESAARRPGTKAPTTPTPANRKRTITPTEG